MLLQPWWNFRARKEGLNMESEPIIRFCPPLLLMPWIPDTKGTLKHNDKNIQGPPFYCHGSILFKVKLDQEKTMTHIHNVKITFWFSITPLGLFSLNWIQVSYLALSRWVHPSKGLRSSLSLMASSLALARVYYH